MTTSIAVVMATAIRTTAMMMTVARRLYAGHHLHRHPPNYALVATGAWTRTTAMVLQTMSDFLALFAVLCCDRLINFVRFYASGFGVHGFVVQGLEFRS